MSGFKALNIESDDESDVEIDDTKEIQIEDALKLYQSALKYHSEGPASFDKAAEAYNDLFQSEIFQYPESQPELRRIELYGPIVDYDDLWLENEGSTGLATVNLETGPSTLPQILHLSHKNYAQFRLEALAANIETLNVNLRHILSDASEALDHFVKALDKDDTDLDLWRRTAAVGEMLNSKRVARFCLEAVLDGDDEGLGSLMSLPGLEDGLAGEQLRDLIAALEDQLSVLQTVAPVKKRKALSSLLKQRLDPYHGITSREKALVQEEDFDFDRIAQPQRLVLRAPDTWYDLGDVLIRELAANPYRSKPASAISFDLQDTPMLEDAPAEVPAHPLPTSTGSPPAPHFDLPTHMSEQFPGLDHGQPTVQPAIANAEPSMNTISRPSMDTDAEMADAVTTVLPSRKRSGQEAGLTEGAEEVRTKSRRTRARESLPDTAESRQAMVDANVQWEFDQQLNERKAADDWLYETVGLMFEKIGVVGFDAGKHVRDELESGPISAPPPSTRRPSPPQAEALKTARATLSQFLGSFHDAPVHLLLTGGETIDFTNAATASSDGSHISKPGVSDGARGSGRMPDTGIPYLLRQVNDSWTSIEEAACEYLKAMTQLDGVQTGVVAYLDYKWPEALKTVVVRIIVNFDEHIFQVASAELETLVRNARTPKAGDLEEQEKFWTMVQTLFELHLDIYCLIKEPNSGVDVATVTMQGDRLQRWSELTREAMFVRSTIRGQQKAHDELNLRFLWATTLNIGASVDVDPDYALECIHDLRATFVAAEDPTIYLQNNAIMPELSVAAIDRKLSELTTRDFFAKIAENNHENPVATIESLEPLLEAVNHRQTSTDSDTEAEQRPIIVSEDLVQFLETSSSSVKLMLWERLRKAYIAIDFTPMAVACHFRMMRLLLDDLKSTDFANLAQDERVASVFKTLRMLHVMLDHIRSSVTTSADALDCMDEANLPAAVSMLGELLHTLQVFNILEDSIQIGQTQPPPLPNGTQSPAFTAMMDASHSLQIETWIVLYGLLKEAISQNAELFPTPVEDRFDFLRCLHRNVGLRGFCGIMNRTFVRLLKDEFFQMTHVDGYDSEQAQVLYDLYGLNCFVNPTYELMEHNCTHDAFVDRGVALQSADLLMAQADKLPIRELVKHPLKDTIEKVHGNLPRKKPTEAIMRNREIARAYLRSPINPLDLYRCLKGEGNMLALATIPETDAPLAAKGWYFLMGHISLTKYRTQKKTGPTSTEEVDIAMAFFNQSMEYSMDDWEVWFRLGQAWDAKIEEAVIWSAERMNTAMGELVQWQRAAIHCYQMATALAFRSADTTFDTSGKMTELYADFAMRMYSSSREPFSMLPFAVDDQEKFLSTRDGMARSSNFKPLRVFTAWKIAKVLFQRAIQGKPRQWMLHFMLGKCLWKMHSATPEVRGRDEAPSAKQVLDTFIRALELVPGKKDSRDTKWQPTLEPHYKLVSIVHKMINRQSIGLDEAREALQHTTYARPIAFPERPEDWTPYILDVLKELRKADKSNWHHRMIYRAAQVVFNTANSPSDGTPATQHPGAAAAKAELTQQMFTRTFVLNVWRPDAERAGRHFVYTTRYTRFFVQMLELLRDRSSMEQLAKRVRRKPNELFEHSSVWHDIVSAYLRLLRSHGSIPEGLETSTFSAILHEEWLERKEILEQWMAAQNTGDNAALDVLREVQELKKVNQGSLFKPGSIDDLIGDAYASLFSTVGKQLWQEQRVAKLEEEAKRPPPQPEEPPPPPRNPAMSVMSLMNMDGASDLGATSRGPDLSGPSHTAPSATPTPAQPEAPVKRKIGVGRREIRTASEACVQKASSHSTTRVTGPITDHPRVSVVIDSSKPVVDSAETSAPGSVHDDADDESELSELEEADADDEAEDEEVVKKPLFPGLATMKDGREASSEYHSAEEGVVGDQEQEEEQDQPMGDAQPQADERAGPAAAASDGEEA